MSFFVTHVCITIIHIEVNMSIHAICVVNEPQPSRGYTSNYTYIY